MVLTSDHGEEFLEHGKFTHDSYFEEVVRVPLVVKWPHGQRYLVQRGTSACPPLGAGPSSPGS